MAQRFRIYHVNANDDTLIETILFDAPSANTNNLPNFSVSNTGSFEGEGDQLVSSYSQISEHPTLNMCYLLADDSEIRTQSYVMNTGLVWNNLNIGDKLYLGRWDHNHSYIKITGKYSNVTPSTGVPTRIDYVIRCQYCCYDGSVAYDLSNTDISSYWMVRSNRITVVLNLLPWLWNWNSPNDWHICGENLYYDLGQYGGYRSLFIAPASTELAQKFWQKVPIIDAGNPYEGAGGTVPGGGDENKQNWDDASDTIGDENLPDESTTGAIGTGFSTIFSPTKSQLQHLADVMWGNDIVSFLQNQVENIGSMFVSLGIVPFAVPKGSTRKVMWLGIVDTAIYLDTAANQFLEFDMGTINMATDARIHRTDSVFDYSPFSRLGIYLPFIGFQELDIDECRENTIGLKYKVDILSGSCVAWIYINGDPIYQFSGNCMTQIPLSSQDAQTLFTNAVQVGIAAASAGMSESVASAGDALTAERYMSGDISATAAELQAGQHAASVSSAQGNLASATANGMMGMKPNYKRSGAISASNSLISLKQPYLFLTTPREAVPERYQKYCGFPSNMTKKLGDLSGYAVVEDIRLNGLVATSPEVEEIYKLLKTGVII